MHSFYIFCNKFPQHINAYNITLCKHRYHQTKLANSCFTAALAAKLETAGITNVKAICAAPGISQTNLQVTAATNGTPTPWFIQSLMQSAEDGTMPLLVAMFGTETKNGDFYEPRNMNGFYGKPTKIQFDKKSSSKEQQQMLWEKSEEACGKFSI
jgi:NAD(P)-dependent dehydrogenase (short-subunit alcohol dehydrogenase family)